MTFCVSNLSHDTSEEDLLMAFQHFGEIESVKIVRDKFSGESRGFGFVEILDEVQAMIAIYSLKGKNLKGKPIKIKHVRSRFKIHHNKRGQKGNRRHAGNRQGGRRTSKKNF